MNQIKEPSKSGGSAIAMLVIIAINGLAKEGDFFTTLICEKSNFRKDMIGDLLCSGPLVLGTMQ